MESLKDFRAHTPQPQKPTWHIKHTKVDCCAEKQVSGGISIISIVISCCHHIDYHPSIVLLHFICNDIRVWNLRKDTSLLLVLVKCQYPGILTIYNHVRNLVLYLHKLNSTSLLFSWQVLTSYSIDKAMPLKTNHNSTKLSTPQISNIKHLSYSC